MSRAALDAIRHAAVWFEPTPDGFDSLLESIVDARLVLIGEASHGTHDSIIELEIIPGATHLFDEPGTVEQMMELATAWFHRHFAGA